MDEKIVKNRQKTVRRLMAEKQIDALIVTAVENVTYLTAFMGHDSWALVTPHNVTLVTDSRYTEQAQSECLSTKIVERRDDMTKIVAKIINRISSVKTIGIQTGCTLGIHRQLKTKLNARIKQVSGIVENARTIKDPTEIKNITAAAKVAWQALDKTLKKLKAGMTEVHATAILEFEMRTRGLPIGFDTITAFGPNGSRNHHQPGQRKLRKNDTILIDFGAKCNGYCSDTTRSFVFGKPAKAYQKAYYAVADAQLAAIKMIRPGVSLKDVDSAARQVFKDRGMPVYGHGTGHGLGLQVHEEPYLSHKAKGKLQVGQVITVEPGLYLPGRFGIRIEDDVLVTEKGHKILTHDNKFGFSDYKMPVLRSR